MTNNEWREHRTEMIHRMELYLGFKEKCRRTELLKHLEPGSTGASLGLTRSRHCCDSCLENFLLFFTFLTDLRVQNCLVVCVNDSL